MLEVCYDSLALTTNVQNTLQDILNLSSSQEGIEEMLMEYGLESDVQEVYDCAFI